MNSIFRAQKDEKCCLWWCIVGNQKDKIKQTPDEDT
jgi:hypothetical protein